MPLWLNSGQHFPIFGLLVHRSFHILPFHKAANYIKLVVWKGLSNVRLFTVLLQKRLMIDNVLVGVGKRVLKSAEEKCQAVCNFERRLEQQALTRYFEKGHILRLEFTGVWSWRWWEPHFTFTRNSLSELWSIWCCQKCEMGDSVGQWQVIRSFQATCVSAFISLLSISWFRGAFRACFNYMASLLRERKQQRTSRIFLAYFSSGLVFHFGFRPSGI